MRGLSSRTLPLCRGGAWCWSRAAASGTGGRRARTMWRPSSGMVRTTEIRVAPEISGRVARFLVEPRQAVQRGQPVAVLSNPELWAAVGVARADVDKARSDRDRVYAGIRDEQVQALQREIEKAQAVHAQAAQELARKTTLALRSDASMQELDTATGAEARARADIAVAEARYAEAQRGPTAEERALADATVEPGGGGPGRGRGEGGENAAACAVIRHDCHSGGRGGRGGCAGRTRTDPGSRQRRMVRVQPA